MNRPLLAFTAVLLLAGCASSYTPNVTSTPESAEAQGTSTEVEISLATDTTRQQEKEARQQLMRLLSEYDLDPWIVTQEVRIEAGVDPHSTPFTLNTKYLDDDKTQLSIFLHEQAHLLPEAKRGAAAQDLRKMYPEIPGLPDESQIPEEQEEARQELEDFRQSVYNHIVVAWVELDAMTEFVGEEGGRRILKEKIQKLTSEPYSALENSFRWYNNRVLEDTQEIGAVLAKHGLVITPERGVTVASEN